MKKKDDNLNKILTEKLTALKLNYFVENYQAAVQLAAEENITHLDFLSWCLRLPGAGSGSNRRGNGLPMAAEFAGRCDFLLLFRCGADNLPGNPQCAKMSRLYP